MDLITFTAGAILATLLTTTTPTDRFFETTQINNGNESYQVTYLYDDAGVTRLVGPNPVIPASYEPLPLNASSILGKLQDGEPGDSF